MKKNISAIVKTTDEKVTVTYHHTEILDNGKQMKMYVSTDGEIFQESDLDFSKKKTPILGQNTASYSLWEERRTKIAALVMTAILIKEHETPEIAAELAVNYADALIEALKKKKHYL